MATQTEHPDPFRLSEAVVLITGALTGIGKVTALAFAKEGLRIVVSGRGEQEGFDFTAKLRDMGTDAEFIYADVRHEEDLKNLIERTVARFQRFGQPEEVANAIVFLGSNRSPFLTGQSVVIDGGRTA
jgi:NAD(P)-dependent dehydrogenase (short-subunit alcohol dehydrogenase family)